MNNIEDGSPHGTLTMGKLVAWCVVGAVMWAGIIQGCIKLLEVL